METEDGGDEFFESFKSHLTEIDELANIVLKGHLVVEGALDELVGIIFLHPEHLGRLSFENKLRVTRAMSRRTEDSWGWDMIMALNSLRNEIAHQPPSAERKGAMDRLRQACVSKLKHDVAERHRGDSDTEMAVLSCTACYAFLGLIEEEFRTLRSHIETLKEE